MEVHTDAVPSPARSEPKSEGQVEQNDNSKPCLMRPQDRVPEEKDAVSSPAQPNNCETGRPEPKNAVNEANNPTPTLYQDKNKNHEQKKHKSSRSSSENHSKTCESKPVKNITQVYGSTNVVVGNVFNINHYEERKQDECKSQNRSFQKLLSCQEKLSTEDMIIISQHMTAKGLGHLSKKLDMDKSDMFEIEEDNKHKGLNETLARWKELNSGKDLSPMLNLVCSALLHKKVYGCGGKEALEGVYEHHFKHRSSGEL